MYNNLIARKAAITHKNAYTTEYQNIIFFSLLYDSVKNITFINIQLYSIDYVLCINTAYKYIINQFLSVKKVHTMDYIKQFIKENGVNSPELVISFLTEALENMEGDNKDKVLLATGLINHTVKVAKEVYPPLNVRPSTEFKLPA